MTMQPDIQHELAEAISEIARHHRDFAQISAIVDKAMESVTKNPMQSQGARVILLKHALKQIRNIVG